MHVPVVLLTGFLGSGKTTILNSLTRNPASSDTAFVINEAGEVGLDQLLVETGEDDVVLLEGGCLCCRAQGSLTAALDALWRRRGPDGVLPFGRIVVETSGLADPIPVLHGMLADAAFRRRFVLAGVVTTVDALLFERSVSAHPQVAAQVAVADRLLITKTDLVGAPDVERLQEALSVRNPAARPVVVRGSEIAAEQVWPCSLALDDIPRAPRMAAIEAADGPPIATAARLFAGRLSEHAVEAWLDHTMDLFGLSLLRLKAMLHIAGRERPVVLHGVQGLLDSADGPAPSAGAEPVNRVVLIGAGVGEVLLSDSIDKLAELADPKAAPARLAP